MQAVVTPSSFGPCSAFIMAWQYRRLIARLAWREIESRYRGSLFGLFWAIAVPLLMLAVYTFVFSVVFEARWDRALQSKVDFAIILFAGLIVFGFFTECLNRSPGLMLENPAYIKKVVFPLEIMPWVSIVVALFNAAVSLIILLLLQLYVHGLPPLSAFLAPLIFLPLIFLTFGIVSILSSLGVYLRDIRYIVGILTTIIMFLSPVFYPLSAIPQKLQLWIYLNPLTTELEFFRKVLFTGGLNEREWLLFSVYSLATWLVAWAGYWWLVKTKKGFADVL